MLRSQAWSYQEENKRCWLTLSICWMFCKRNLWALYHGRNTSLIISFTPFSWNLSVSALTTGELIKYNLVKQQLQITRQLSKYRFFLIYDTKLFRQRLSHKSVKAYATMPIGIMGSKSLVLLDWGLRRFSNKEARKNEYVFVLFLSTTLKLLEV